MIRSSQNLRLCGLLTLGAALQVLTAPKQDHGNEKLSLRSKKPASQLSLRAHVGTGCFFWESDCVMSEVMCGTSNLIHEDVKVNKCKRFVYFFNHANDHCSMDESALQKYKECFWAELSVHLPPRDKCGEVCSDSHSRLPRDVEKCDQQCNHVHDCTDECKTDKYQFRDAISECYSTCMLKSPVNPVGTCRGSCGGHAPNMKCHCDPTCSYTDDCCDDYENFCLVAGMRWNESLPLPNKTFALPGFNISAKDVDQMGNRHQQVAVRYDVSDEVHRRAKQKLQGEYDEKQQERIHKQRSKAERQGKLR
eukprot:gnl/MRDRNA2_/MRDRNA2_117194_c0_seq1.p1 gnl/MRDRNA2_/MRDRNA2_117194_c0~~gnl/MRDRNA2_/MRDRNA2_117194_c0_seq1.p1  ORF type:complete len:307 (+),score=33.91 gnl/MRDRNA2_/MRDRNA2_117194_c0_seq1:96-1016(+)